MRIFLGILIGLALAVGIAFVAGYAAFGDMVNIDDRDKSNDVTEVFDVAGFDGIDVGGVFELDVTSGADYSVTVSGPADELERLEVSVENGELVLGRSGDSFRMGRQNPGMTAVVTLPTLTSIDVSGVADGEVRGVDADAFQADLSGVGSLDIEGQCGTLEARLTGVGELDARGLLCANVDVAVSGVGEAAVYASESVDARVGGIGSITIYGSPAKVEKDSGFMSDITVK